MNYSLRRSGRATRLTVKLDAQGEVVVTAPNRLPIAHIEKALDSAKEWIAVHQAKHQRLLNQHPELGGRSELLYKGKPYKVVLAATGASVYVDEAHHTFFLNPVEPTLDSIQKTLIRFLRRQAEVELQAATGKWAERMGQKVTQIRLRDQKSRWGSCSHTGTISYTWKLIHVPPAVLEYVVIHELAHRKHMNHSAAFWQFVRSFDGRYDEHRAWLHRYGVRVQQNVFLVAQALGKANQ